MQTHLRPTRSPNTDNCIVWKKRRLITNDLLTEHVSVQASTHSKGQASLWKRRTSPTCNSLQHTTYLVLICSQQTACWLKELVFSGKSLSLHGLFNLGLDQVFIPPAGLQQVPGFGATAGVFKFASFYASKDIADPIMKETGNGHIHIKRQHLRRWWWLGLVVWSWFW
jgi:hypothetical protein